jgi:hypothetical protein
VAVIAAWCSLFTLAECFKLEGYGFSCIMSDNIFDSITSQRNACLLPL